MGSRHTVEVNSQKERLRKRFTNAFRASGFTEQETAEYLGISKRTVQLWLAGQRKPHSHGELARRIEDFIRASRDHQVPQPSRSIPALALPHPPPALPPTPKSQSNGHLVVTARIEWEKQETPALLSYLREISAELTKRM